MEWIEVDLLTADGYVPGVKLCCMPQVGYVINMFVEHDLKLYCVEKVQLIPGMMYPTVYCEGWRSDDADG